MTPYVPRDIAAGLREAFPDQVEIDSLSVLTEGANSLVLVSRGEYIFRIGKNKASFLSYQKESALLPAVARLLDIAVPVPGYLSGPTQRLPYGAIGYRKLPGRPLSDAGEVVDRDLVAEQMSEFMRQLHSIPLDDFQGLGLPECLSGPNTLARFSKQLTTQLADYLEPSELEFLKGWLDQLQQDDRLQEYEPTIVHGDLACWNVLVNDQSSAISGIVDFEAACIGDPADDLLTQCKFGVAFYKKVLAVYEDKGGQIGPSFEHRVRQLKMLRLLYSLIFHVEAGDDVEIAKAVRRLRRSVVASAETT